MDSIVECLNCGVVWTKRATMKCPRCGRPENPDWEKSETTDFEKRYYARKKKNER